MAKNVARAGFALLLSVGDKQTGDNLWTYKNYDCGAVSLNFAMNRIPTGSCVLASGRNLQNLAAGTIHSAASTFVTVRPAYVSLYPEGEWLPEETRLLFFDRKRWTDAGPQVIFNGYVSNLGYARRYGQTVSVVYLTHWLSDLSFASILSDQSHPANPAKFRWWATSGPTGDSTTVRTPFVASRVNRANFLIERIREDFWSRSLHPMFADLSESDILWRLKLDGCSGIQHTNQNAQRALRLFETKKGEDKIGPDYRTGASSPYFKPLAFTTPGGAETEEAIGRSIAYYMTRSTLEAYFNATHWDKLVGELGPSFAFSIVPRVHTAMVVPFVPGLRTTFDQEYGNGKVLDFNDIDSWETSSAAVRPLRAVGILPSDLRSQTGYDFVTPPPNKLGGCFVPDEEAPGMVLYRRPPRWLDNVPAYTTNPQATLLGGQPGSATTPQPVSQEAVATTPTSVVSGTNSFYDNHAHYLYAQEMLRGRSARLQGKLRFDLAPGTTVFVRNAAPLFLENDQLSPNAVASISCVNISIDAEAPSAGTAFQLEYLRTEAENQNDRTSIDRHPLYATIFTGAPLVHAYLFPE